MPTNYTYYTCILLFYCTIINILRPYEFIFREPTGSTPRTTRTTGARRRARSTGATRAPGDDSLSGYSPNYDSIQGPVQGRHHGPHPELHYGASGKNILLKISIFCSITIIIPHCGRIFNPEFQGFCDEEEPREEYDQHGVRIENQVVIDF